MIRSRLAVLLLPAVTLLGCHEDLGVVAGRPAERVEVAEVEIHGVTAVDEPALRSVLETRESPWLPWSEPEYFSRDVFQADLERVTAFYADRGYPHARVVESDVELRDGGEAVETCPAKLRWRNSHEATSGLEFDPGLIHCSRLTCLT